MKAIIDRVEELLASTDQEHAHTIGLILQCLDRAARAQSDPRGTFCGKTVAYYLDAARAHDREDL